MSARQRALSACLIAYLVALATAASIVRLDVLAHEPLWAAAAADLSATLVIFAFSLGLSNSSMYDPYWSVAPPALLAYWLSQGELSPRGALAGVLVLLWGARLTWNFLRGWRDLGHEEFRYRDLRARTGRTYWLVSLLGIHLFPTVLTFLGSLALWVLTRPGSRPLGWLDALAFVVTTGGVAFETVADEQLRRFRLGNPPKDRILASGLWRYSRHPNYFGEVTFWWGLFLFGLAAHPTAWWTVAGPLAITLLFVFISIPMIDRRMASRRPSYAEHARRTSPLVPFPPKASA